MASLFAIDYPDNATAEAALETVKGLESAGYLTVMEQALVTKSESGEISVGEEKHPVQESVIAGGVIGAIAGAIFFAPLAGATVGAAIGGVIGRSNTSGGEEDFAHFRDTVQTNLPNGGAALAILGRSDAGARHSEPWRTWWNSACLRHTRCRPCPDSAGSRPRRGPMTVHAFP